MAQKRKTVPENPIEFFLMDLYFDEELPLIQLDLRGNKQPHTGHQIFNSMDTRPSLNRAFTNHGFPPVSQSWKLAHRYFTARFELEAAIRAEKWGKSDFLLEGKKSRPSMEKVVETERERLREKWPCIPTRKQLEDDPGYRKRMLSQLLAVRKESGNQEGEANSRVASNPAPEKSQRRLPPPAAKGPVNSAGAQIISPQAPHIPQTLAKSQLTGGTLIPVEPPGPVLSRKRKQGDTESSSAPASGGSNPNPSGRPKKRRKAIRAETPAHHASHGAIPHTQVQANYPGVIDDPQPALSSYPSTQTTLYQFDTTDFSYPTGDALPGQDFGDFASGRHQYSQPHLVNGSVHGGSQWQGQSQGSIELLSRGQMAQHFSNQYPLQTELGATLDMQGNIGAVSSGHMYPQLPRANVQGGFYDGAGPSSQTLDQPFIDWKARESFSRSATEIADMLFRNYPWCQVNPPWPKLRELAQSEAAWNAWVDAPPGCFNS